MKRIGGCGGTHIRRWRPGESLPPGFFLQREVQGTPMSAVVLSDGREARVIGYNELWLNPTAGQPFRWGGAVAVRPDPAVQSAVASAAQDLLQLFDLIGLFGIDWVLDSQGEIAILEVNPRPPATFPLHEGKSSLLAAHLAACAGEMPDWQADTTSHRALTIVYTEAGFNIPSDWQWPDWTADRPTLGMEIRSGEPVCTVLVEADTAQNARDLVAQRVRELMDELLAR
jgi:predicted ATP-grasp superfamily ATP-dependent carboligase